MSKNESDLKNQNSLNVRSALSTLHSHLTAEQQKRKLNLEVTAIMSGLKLPASQRGDVRSAYVIAEDLALRQIALEFNLPIVRHVALEGVPFDAAAFAENQIFCVEVLFLAQPDLSQARIDAVLEKTSHAVKKMASAKTKIRLLLALVTQLSPEAEEVLRVKLRKSFGNTPVDIDVKMFDFEFLQRTFLSE